ncbi:ArsR/SmtB family transcription factor [Pseudalkalibacillus berkeleyi]|uniref:Metalloregulator ArsR/SmtB family transcription factor n=1 Tax=Pseudalkalibacillus berkeleyi TaxID=1069813 RepID=A0ABS9GXI3_9BACL|nr:metalloregulator ArsR/SmtB family transcription factor [Pseudalkalibacillus berkeleyi]MCF6136293.1 metalloregulator ArsR/SmtB family transcription factor [Pseudalkalibacillus berkeleyi]
MNVKHNKERFLESFRNAIPLFQALADPVRQELILLLAENERLNVNEIAEYSPMSRPTISHHLKILKQVQIVSSEKKGTQNYYKLEVERSLEQLKDLVKVIESECIFEQSNNE